MISLHGRLGSLFEKPIIADRSKEWDSDTDLTEFELKQGDLIDFNCPNTRGPEWIEAEVKEVFDEMIFVQYSREDMQMESYPQEAKKEWVARDSEQLAPANTKRLSPLDSIEQEEEELQFGHDNSDNENSSSEADYHDGEDDEENTGNTGS